MHTKSTKKISGRPGEKILFHPLRKHKQYFLWAYFHKNSIIAIWQHSKLIFDHKIWNIPCNRVTYSRLIPPPTTPLPSKKKNNNNNPEGFFKTFAYHILRHIPGFIEDSWTDTLHREWRFRYKISLVSSKF